ncbi:MAG: hypothetical protein US58_C0014G0007 [Candidatus Magasanikbacteria bacterium GW2011_GWA2_37_8]|uniref:Uncharacterized protein n=1 Tax=Candidatus Magasanikbacteria bacterium GW2011_GWA2_37_8 TaxID=1619036 RepID=A0A0G0HPW7_9BACT|nr:MAG: hypothetical protein US58_C0014G0007 [Candidatus Magasanikbacteria bacterium GW2011_GWA2_37_8]
MSRKLSIFLVIIFVFCAGLLVARFWLGEDNWVCTNGEWVKHGNPDSAKPTEGCNKDLSDGTNTVITTNTPYDSQIDREVPTSTILRYNNDVLQIYTPLSGAPVSSPLIIKGLAPSSWFFEAVFPVKLLDENGKEIGVGLAGAKADWMVANKLLPFVATINFVTPTNSPNGGTVVFSADNPAGLPQFESSVSMPVKFSPAQDTTLINIYFSNSRLNPNIQDCSLVFPVERLITKTPAVGQKAIELLLAGVDDLEKTAEYSTAINPGVKLNSLKITNGVAYEFPTVQNVVISINGRTEDILQP